MTDAELIDWEVKIRHAVHGLEKRMKGVSTLLETFAAELAEHRGIGPELRSGGDDKPSEEPPPPPPPPPPPGP